MTSKSIWMTGLQYQRRRPLLAGVSLVLLLATWFVASMVLSSIAQDPNKPKPTGKIRKPSMADTIRANIYADNWFMLYINGEVTVVDSIKFIPHNVISVDLLPSYPMTIAVMARDNADPKTGMEYANTNIGDGGFILKFADGTITDATWKAKAFSTGPVGGDTKNPRVENTPLPENWFAVDYDDSSWPKAKEYSEEEVKPKQPYYDNDFQGAKFIWSDDVKLDNLVLFRKRVDAAPDGKERMDFTNLNNVVPEQPPRGDRRGPPK
jgi:hypothetical protein